VETADIKLADLKLIRQTAAGGRPQKAKRKAT
jgi:hypothetical protein